MQDERILALEMPGLGPSVFLYVQLTYGRELSLVEAIYGRAFCPNRLSPRVASFMIIVSKDPEGPISAAKE